MRAQPPSEIVQKNSKRKPGKKFPSKNHFQDALSKDLPWEGALSVLIDASDLAYLHTPLQSAEEGLNNFQQELLRVESAVQMDSFLSENESFELHVIGRKEVVMQLSDLEDPFSAPRDKPLMPHPTDEPPNNIL